MVRILSTSDHGQWRGKHRWTIRMRDDEEDVIVAVSAVGETKEEAIAHARKSFDERLKFSPEQRQRIPRLGL